jgi:N-acetyltransferase 10
MSKTTERIKLDNRLRLLIENGQKTNQRSIISLVGEQGRNQVVHIHNLLSKASVKARPSVLWCYKKDLGFSTHRKKRMKMLQKRIKEGTMEVNEDDPFELFICATEIRWTYYKDTQKILGKTYDMLVLQDFEAITPNLLARTIETIAGGGLVIFLFKSLQSLKQLYALSMDVHNRYRTEAHKLIKPRFNERFIISLKSNKNAIFMDDKWNILNITSGVLNIKPVPKPEVTEAAEKLKEIKIELADTQPIGSIVALAKTFDQANSLLKFVDLISEKKFRSTVSLTSGRGRGKSAALGLSIAVALAYGYSNIFVTSPSPDNLTTLFDFLLKGLDALKYDQNQDYDIIQSNNENMKKCIVRINLLREHRQTVQYIAPEDYKMLSQAELVIIDEAAAIPLPTVRNLLGPYLVFMSSTINGYEGTGRSLSLKLLDSLRKEATVSDSANVGSRSLAELSLDESIRYAPGCPVEQWLNELLCLDCRIPRADFSLPSPEKCSLYWIDRDVLFSGNKSSEYFLSELRVHPSH